MERARKLSPNPPKRANLVAFPTLDFVFFFLVTVSVTWALRRFRTIQKGFLLFASYVFYAKWDFKLAALLFAVSLGNYLFGELIDRAKRPGWRRAWMIIGVVANVALLGVFKLYDFFRESLDAFSNFLGLEAHLPIVEIILPIGISFYTFQGIAYLVDTYRDKAVRPRTLLDFLLFMAFFPKLLSGPIVRSDELLPQIMEEEAPKEIAHASEAATLIFSGLVKKVILAGYLATHMVDGAFQLPETYSSLELTVAIYAYTAQLYLDFSGYTDLARGLALLLGFRLPENFRYPYGATNIGEFWRRWHITFSRWLRDYIYFPLGGSRVPRARTYLNLIITFTVCGIWHGSRWGFVIWGLLHGVALAAYKFSVDIRRDKGRDPKHANHPLIWKLAGWFATLTFCGVVRIFFRAEDMQTALDVFRGLFAFTIHGQGLDVTIIVVTILSFALGIWGRPVYERSVRAFERVPTWARPAVFVSLGLLLLAIKPSDIAPYIYFQF